MKKVFLSLMVALFCISPYKALAVYGTWGYKVKIVVHNPTNVTRHDYPVRIDIPAELYIDAGRMNEDLRDIRFSQGGNRLPFWIHISEGMQRKVNNLPVYVRLKTLSPGDNIVYLHFDKRKRKGDEPPGGSYCGDFTPTAETRRTCAPTPGSFPYSHDDCGDRVFAPGLFAYTSRDSGDWKVSNAFGDRFEMWASKQRFSNEFCLHFRGHYYTGQELEVYFLIQHNITGWLNSNTGYRLYIDHIGPQSNDRQWNRQRHRLTIQKNTVGAWNTWNDVASFDWYPYHNTIQDFEIKVTSSKIELWVNGLKVGQTNRSDSWTGGYVGFRRLGWQGKGECGSNSLDGISPIWVINNYIGQDPLVRVLGQTDIEIKRITPTIDPGYIGRDIIEYLPKRQILQDKVTENNIEHYVYSTFTLADLKNQVFRYRLKIRNRGDAIHTFGINLNVLAGDIGKSWFIAYKYDGSDYVYNLPGGDLYSGSKAIGNGAEWEMEIFVMPSDRALFQSGGIGRLVLEFMVKSKGDLSFDTAKFISNIVPRPECSYWNYKLPITIRYDDIYGTGDLVDYQVLINLSGITELKHAKDNGSDIIFIDEDGSMVPFWIKSFNKTAKTGSFWVKVPRIRSGRPGTKLIYMFWGNPDYPGGISSIKETFDFWEDWEKRGLNEVVGEPNDPGGWENIPTPDDNYNWWVIRNRLDGKALMADRGSSFKSNDIGPFVVGGDVRWESYEVIYSFYDEYCNYSGCGNPWGNPQYNPVFHQDPGNTWGIEFFADMFIFRPFAYGTDWTWAYQSYPRNIIGESFPTKNKRYWVKIKLFKNPSDRKTYLRILIAKSSPADIDSDAGYTEITENPGRGYGADPAFSLEGGGIGFGGWNGGFSFDNIRVRKYTSPEPTVSIGSVVGVGARPIRSLSFPTLTPPLMNGRPVFMRSDLTPWKWWGDLFAFYADCLIAGDCRSGECKKNLGTISLWGKKNEGTPYGAGEHLKEREAGDNNSEGRVIYTAYDKNNDNSIRDDSERLNFEVSKAITLRPLLGVRTDQEAVDLIRFVRGIYIRNFTRSDARNDKGKQWKLGDVIHSNPLIVGVPNMGYSDPKYWKDFVEPNRKRDLVAYFGSNEGMVHGVRLARWDTGAKKYMEDHNATELWAFIPNEILPRLIDTTDTYHEYLTDGLLRAIDVKFAGDPNYKTVLVVGTRTGARSLLALNITNPTDPKFLWEINSKTHPAAFDKIGETFSTAALGRLRMGNNNDPWVAIIGSGLDPYDPKNLSKKAHLTVVNLQNGDIIKQVEISGKRANIITDMAVLRENNGYLDKIYFGDHYGALWRIDLSTTSKVTSFLAKPVLSETDMLFKPADYSSSDISASPPDFPDRPITAQPRLAMDGEKTVWAYFGTGSYGMRETNYPYQRFYGLKDNVTTPYLDAGLVAMTNSNSSNSDKKSWYIELGRNDERDYEYDRVSKKWVKSTKNRNERVLTTPEVYGGFVFFTTFTPNDNPCGGGVTRFYGVGYNTGRYEGDLIKGVSEDVRSVVPNEPASAKESVPSRPYIYVGQDKAGKPVAKGLVNLGTGELAEIELNPQRFAEMLNILLWREIR